jgi:hypothetical protein
MSKGMFLYRNIFYWLFAISGAILIYAGSNAKVLFGVLFILLAVRMIIYWEAEDKAKNPN